MYIHTRCRTVDELVAMFRRFVTGDSLFVATLSQSTGGSEFRVLLVNGATAFRGRCVVSESWVTADSPYRLPGMLLAVRDIAPETQPVFDRIRGIDRTAPVQPPPVPTRSVPRHPPSVTVPPPLPPAARARKVAVPPPLPVRKPVPSVRVPEIEFAQGTVVPGDGGVTDPTDKEITQPYRRVVVPMRAPTIGRENPIAAMSDAALADFVEGTLCAWPGRPTQRRRD